jgi:surface protein
MMFSYASSFTSDLSQWQTGKVTDMGWMFDGASSFDSDLSKWQTGNVIDMHNMFLGATSLQKRPTWYKG